MSTDIINIETSDSNTFELILKVIKEVILQANIQFKKKMRKDEETGEEKMQSYLEIHTPNSKGTIFIHLKLNTNGSSFDKFYITDLKKSFNIGIDIQKLYGHIKSTEKESKLTLIVNENTNRYLDIINESKDGIIKKKVKMPILELAVSKPRNHNAVYDVCVAINSVDFNTHCKQLDKHAEKIEIICRVNCLIMKTYNDNDDYDSKIEYIMKYDPNEKNSRLKILMDEKREDISNYEVRGIFYLKDIIAFSKCQDLAQSVNLYMLNTKLMVLQYNIAKDGELILFFAGCNEKKN